MFERLTPRQSFSAVLEKQLDKIRIAVLIEDSIDLSIENAEGETLISYAAKLKHWDCIALLLHGAHKKDPAERKKFGLDSALVYAVVYEQVDYIEKLLLAGADADTACEDDSGFYVLHRAVQNSNLQLIELLLTYKANPSIRTHVTIKNAERLTPLELAVQQDKPKTISLLLDAKADTTVKDSKGHTPIEQAALLGRWDCVDQFLYHSHEKSPACLGFVLKLAVRTEDNMRIDSLIKQGALLTFHAVDTGFYPLHEAVFNGYFDIVERLLEAKADPLFMTKSTSQHKEPRTALQLAIQRGHNEIAELLDKRCAIIPENIKQDFCHVHSFMEVYNKLQDLSSSHTLNKIFLLSKYISDSSVVPLFKLGCLILLLQQKRKGVFLVLENIEFFFKNKLQESHFYIAKAILEVIQNTFESNKKIDLVIKKEIRKLFTPKIIESKTDDFSVDPLHELGLIEETYCYHLDRLIYDDLINDFLRDRIFQIAACEYLKKNIQDRTDISENTKDLLTRLFGKTIFQRHWFLGKKSLLFNFTNEAIKFSLGENQNLLSSQMPATAPSYYLDDSRQSTVPLTSELLDDAKLIERTTSFSTQPVVTSQSLYPALHDKTGLSFAPSSLIEQKAPAFTEVPSPSIVEKPLRSEDVGPTVSSDSDVRVSAVGMYKKSQRHSKDESIQNNQTLILAS
jgi:ankyrin repeat protein